MYKSATVTASMAIHTTVTVQVVSCYYEGVTLAMTQN